MPTPPELIDLDRCPIADLTAPPGRDFARRCRREYARSGLCMLPGFVRAPALAALRREAEAGLDRAYFCDSEHNAYLSADPADALGRPAEQTFVGSIAYDQIPRRGLLDTLYRWEPLKDFIGYVLGKPALHRFADPFGACSINVFVDGGRHGWHFDESEFTVTLLLQAPQMGGEFEYAPQIRGRENERQLVGRILDGGRDAVVTLPFTPGALLIFGGRQTLHRVAPVAGRRPRLVPVLCYAERPGMQNSAAVRQLFWGRAQPGDPLPGPPPC